MNDRITTLILAGGRSSRMGQDKAGLLIGEKSVLEKILENVPHLRQLATASCNWLALEFVEAFHYFNLKNEQLCKVYILDVTLTGNWRNKFRILVVKQEGFFKTSV